MAGHPAMGAFCFEWAWFYAFSIGAFSANVSSSQRAAAKARKAIMGAAAGDMYISEAGSSLMDTANRYASAARRKSPVRNSPSISTHPAMSAGGAFWRTPRTHRGT